MGESNFVNLPNGRSLNLARTRSDGPLSIDELAYCRQHNIPLAYDPVSYGWVFEECVDDVSSAASSNPIGSWINIPPESRAEFNVEMWFDGAQASWWERWQNKDISVDQLMQGLWSLPDLAIERAQSYGEMAAPRQVRFFCRLQQQIALSLHRGGLMQDLGRGGSKPARQLEQKYTFRPWEETDLDRYLELLDNAAMWRYLPGVYPNPLSRADALNLIETSNTMSNIHEVSAVLLGEEIVGQVRLQMEGSSVSPGPAEHDAEISYWLGEAYWGKGLMSEIIQLFTLRTFQNHPLSSVSAWVERPNLASIRVLEKTGYRYIGDRVSSISRGPEFPVYRAFRYQPEDSLGRSEIEDTNRESAPDHL